MQRAVSCLAVALAAACGAAGPPTDPHLVEVSAEPTATLVTAGRPGELAVRVRVSAGRTADEGRAPLDLALALDTSGSMEGAPMTALRRSARALVERMNDGDHLAIVAFDTTARVIVPSVALDDTSRAEALAAIDRLEPRGTTALAEGLSTALAQVAAGHTVGSIDRVVLFGDGVPNDPAPIASLVTLARSRGVSITTLGFGLESDETGLRAIAADTGGVFRFMADPAQVADVFDRELVRMQTVVARNVVVRLQPGPGVTIEDLPGLSSGGAVRVAVLGDLAAGDLRDVIVPLRVGPHRDGATVELLDATVTFEDAVAGAGTLARTSYTAVHASADASAVAAATKVDIEIARARARAAAAIVWAIDAARNGMIDNARAALAAAATSARADAARLHDGELTALAERIDVVAARIAELARVAQAPPDATDDQIARTDGPAAAQPMAPAPTPGNDGLGVRQVAQPRLQLDEAGERELRANFAAAQDVLDQRH